MGQTIEINGACAVDVYFVDHVVELCIGGIEAEGLHHGAELVSCDDAWDRKACQLAICWGRLLGWASKDIGERGVYHRCQSPIYEHQYRKVENEF